MESWCEFLSSKGDCPQRTMFRVMEAATPIFVCGDHLPLQVRRIAKVAPERAVSVYVIEENSSGRD